MKGIIVMALFAIAVVCSTNGAPVETEAAASASTAKQPQIAPVTTIFANPSASTKSSITDHPRHKRRRHHRRRHKLHRHRHKLYPLKDRLQKFVGGSSETTSNLLASVKTPRQDFEMTNGEVFEHGGVPDLRLRQDMSRIGYGVYNEHGDQGEKYATKEDIEPQKTTTNKPSNDYFTPTNSPYLAEHMNAKKNPLLYESVGMGEPSSSEHPKTSLSSSGRGPGYSSEGFGFTPPTGIVRHDVENSKQIKQNLTENTIFLGGNEVSNFGGPGLLGARAFDNDGHLLGANYNADLRNSNKDASNTIDDSVVLVGQDQKQVLKSDPRVPQPVSKNDLRTDKDGMNQMLSPKPISTNDMQNETSVRKKTDVNKESEKEDGDDPDEEDEDDGEKDDESDEDEKAEHVNGKGSHLNDREEKPETTVERHSESESKHKGHEQLQNTKDTSLENDEKYTMGLQDLINTKEANRHGIQTGIVDPMLCDLAALTMMEEASKEHKDLSNIGLNDVTSLASKCFRKNLEVAFKHRKSTGYGKAHNVKSEHKHEYRKKDTEKERHNEDEKEDDDNGEPERHVDDDDKMLKPKEEHSPGYRKMDTEEETRNEVEKNEDNRDEPEGPGFRERGKQDEPEGPGFKERGKQDENEEGDEEKEEYFPPLGGQNDHRRNNGTSQEDQEDLGKHESEKDDDSEKASDDDHSKSPEESAPPDAESEELNGDNIKQALDDDKVMVGTQDAINIQNRQLSGERMDSLICQMRAARRALGADDFSKKDCLKQEHVRGPSPVNNISTTDVQELAVLKISPKGNANHQKEKADLAQQMLQTPGLTQQLIRPPLPFAWQSLDTRIQNGMGHAPRVASPFHRRLSREQESNVVHPPQSSLDSVNFVMSALGHGKGNGNTWK